MERRVLLAIFLSFLVLYVYQALVVKPVPPQPPVTVQGGTPPASPPSTPGPGPGLPQAVQPPVEQPASATPLVSEPAEREIPVETSDVMAVFTNRGARLKSWRLKHYRDAAGQPQELIEQALDIPTAAGTVDRQPLPFTLKVSDAAVTDRINQAIYAVTRGADAPNALRFEYRDSSGLRVTKQFDVDPASYVLTFRAAVAQQDRPLPAAIQWGPSGGATAVSSFSQGASGLLFQNGEVLRLAPADIPTQPDYEGDFEFAGVDDNYFMTVALSVTGAKISFQPVSIPPAAGRNDAARELVAYSVDPRTVDQPIRFFVGPKDFGVLSAVNRDLPNAIHFGVFKVIVVPLLQSLKWVNSFVGNYGWSIVILTIVINAIMFPLRHKSTVSMRKMQELQPEVKAIQDRYAKLKSTDPAKQKMNQELMALYRERGVNPASGCVPILLTMPVLLAMWALLQTSIELRGAPWFGWIRDLSVHDPYYVLAVLMGVTGFWQQRMMPMTGADPAQQKMMMFMPLMMTVMLAWLPAGALIYYVVTNIWMIGQQYLTNYLIGPPAVRTIRPPAERRLKRAAGGKSEAAARDAE
jgi:YidC/Oxa1 family membrane protein insertase